MTNIFLLSVRSWFFLVILAMITVPDLPEHHVLYHFAGEPVGEKVIACFTHRYCFYISGGIAVVGPSVNRRSTVDGPSLDRLKCWWIKIV